MLAVKNVVVATLNINGVPSFYHIKGAEEVLVSHTVRHKFICSWFETSGVDIISFQEVFTYRNLNLLQHHLPSYPHISYKPFLFGPKGALVTFSKFPITTTGYYSYASPAKEADRSQLPKVSLLRSALKGVLVSRIGTLPLTIINTHLLYNSDGDWSLNNRFHSIQKAQLDMLARVVESHMETQPERKMVVVGDFNIEVGELSRGFTKGAGLYDVFEGDNTPSFHNEFLADVKTKRRIDYLLTNDKKAVATNAQRIFTQRSQIDNKRRVYLSDHQGLMAVLSVD